MPTIPEDDITIRLAVAALDTEDLDPGELEALLREAIWTIETLPARRHPTRDRA